MNYRHELGMVSSDDAGAVAIENFGYCDLDIAKYSEFKYGRGDVARMYGQAMARLLFANHPELLAQEELYVSSSAYKAAPPASNSLVSPFVQGAQEVVAQADSPLRVIPFKINRTTITQGDYASMSLAEREVIMSKNGLCLPEGVDIADTSVVALDDIFVTGSHEKSIEELMRKSSVRDTYYLYILRVANGHLSPQIEAQINGTTVTSIDDVLRISEVSCPFVPNARLCKFILSQPADDIERFVSTVDQGVLDTITTYATNDGLAEMATYSDGYHTLLQAQSPAMPTAL